MSLTHPQPAVENPTMPINLTRFDLVTLRLFVLVVDGGSLTAGAAEFGISVAAASKRVIELESRVGQTLLERSQRGIVPTAAGRTLQRHAIELLGRLQQLAVAMDDYKLGAGGHLRLWANTSAFSGFLPDLLAVYMKAHPDVVIDLEDAFSEDAARAVVSGAAELGVIGENTLTDGLQSIICDTDELVLLVPATHRLGRLKRVGLAQALEHDLVALGHATSLMRHIASAAEAAGCRMRIRVQVRSFDALSRMVAAGLGVAILPRAGAAPHAAAMGLRLVPLEGAWVQRRLRLAMRDRQQLSGPARAFVELVERRAGAARTA
jgi:DNA-binding transcriptional LysR family regulator